MNKTPTQKLIVQKYGGATLATPEKIKQAALRISKLHREGTKVVVVVSAMGQTTNELIALAHEVSPRPQLREMDMLLTVGERISMSLMSMALNDLGCPAISFTGSQAGILTDESHVNANIIDVKATRVEAALAENKVVIMAGFQGVSPVTKEITTLGRGGSDTSAVAMAGYLKADRCEILKDVDGVYTADPKVVAQARSIPFLNYSQLLEMTFWGAKVLHQRSVEMAQLQNVKLYVGPASANTSDGTVITSDFNFPSKKAVALNSYHQVFEMHLADSFAQFTNFLTQNQMSKPQLLCLKDKAYMVTGPAELLTSLENFERGQDVFTLTNKKVSSISLTFSEMTTDEDLESALRALASKKITPLHQFNLMNSAHFFVAQDQKAEAIQLLHSFIS